MKFLILINFFLFLTLSHAQKLTSSQKKEWRHALKEMEKTDQHYRVMMVEKPSMDNDSIWKLQSINDSINKQKFVELTTKFGYPSFERVGDGFATVLILHFTMPNDFIDLKDLFKIELDKGNMPPKDYAWWYDRCQKNSGLPIYFGQYTNLKFCGEELRIFNERRKEINLETLIAGPNCE